MYSINICRFNKYNSLCHFLLRGLAIYLDRLVRTLIVLKQYNKHSVYLRFRPSTFNTKLTVYWVMVNIVNNVIRLPAFSTLTHTHAIVYFNCFATLLTFLPQHFSSLSLVHAPSIDAPLIHAETDMTQSLALFCAVTIVICYANINCIRN